MLELTDVSVVLSKGTINEKHVFNNFSLTINYGDFATIIGSNGAGKSTLFNTICGNVQASSGSIILNGEDITTLPDHKRARKIGRLFQDPNSGTAPDMSIEENLFLASGRGHWITGISKSDREFFKEKVSELGMGLEDKLNKPVKLLSGGQRQAITLLMATMSKPSLLLLDEHTAALDPKTAEIVLEMTNKIVTENKITCLMITHNMQSALDYGNRTLMMQNGTVIFDTSGEERKQLTVNDLLVKFKENAGIEFTNDRMLLS